MDAAFTWGNCKPIPPLRRKRKENMQQHVLGTHRGPVAPRMVQGACLHGPGKCRLGLPAIAHQDTRSLPDAALRAKY